MPARCFPQISGRRNRVVPISLWSQCLHIGDAFAAELVRPDLRLHAGKVPARRKRDKEHPGAAGEGQTVAAGCVLILDRFMTARSTSHQNWTMRGFVCRQASTSGGSSSSESPISMAPIALSAPTEPP